MTRLKRAPFSNCRTSSGASAGMTLGGPGGSEAVGLERVERGEPSKSWLYRKATDDFAGTACLDGASSRETKRGDLGAADRQTLETWTEDGAKSP